MKPNPVKAKLAAGEVPVGTFVVEFDTAGIARLAASAGAEWILYDMEHSGWSISQIKQAVAHARGAGIMSVVRPPALEYHLCSGPLDAGAMGIMAPMVETAHQAELLVTCCKYPPLGRRGTFFGIAHDDYEAGNPSDTIRTANDEVLTIAIIETPKGVENVEAIAAVDGLDMLFLGFGDLTSFMGIPFQFDHPDFIAAVDAVLAAAVRHGKTVGIVVQSVAEAETRLGQGFGCLLYGVDLFLYKQALAAGISGVRDLLARREQPVSPLPAR